MECSGVQLWVARSAAVIACTASVITATTDAAVAAPVLYTDRAAFLNATGARSATGPLPNRGPVERSVTLGRVTLTTGPRATGIHVGTSRPDVPNRDWTARLPGPDIALDDTEDLDVTLSAPTRSLGFDVVEPENDYNGSGGQPFIDSTFAIRLFNGSTFVDQALFNVSNDKAAFVGVSSAGAFNRVEIREAIGGVENEYFGQFYTSQVGILGGPLDLGKPASVSAQPGVSARARRRSGFGVGARDPVGQPVESANEAAYLGASVARVGLKSNLTVAQILPIKRAYDARDIEIILVAEADQAGPTPDKAANLASWAKHFGPKGRYARSQIGKRVVGRPVRHIEFGNENGYIFINPKTGKNVKAGPKGGGRYAKNYSAAYRAINGRKGNRAVGLLAQADAAAVGTWVNRMFKAQPSLGRKVADRGGWVVHPYGPGWKRKLDAVVKQTCRKGASSSIPLFITEWGVASTSNGRTLKPNNFGWERVRRSGGRRMKYAQAARALRGAVKGMSKNFGSRIHRLILFQQSDGGSEPGEGGPVKNLRDLYMGVLKARFFDLRNSPFQRRHKGDYTNAVKKLARTLTFPSKRRTPRSRCPRKRAPRRR